MIGESPLQLALACAVALVASTLGGLSGFGTGLILPLVLVPLVGVTKVIPLMAVAMLLTNGSRVIAYHREIDRAQARRILVLGLPACLCGAWGYTLLSAQWITALLGSFLLLSVPLRRVLRRAARPLSPAMQLAAGAGFGVVNGGVSGAGVILISILMSAGLTGGALIATDAIVSLTMGLAKVALFGGFAALDLELALLGLLIGACTVPGAFIARALLARLPAGLHAGFMEAVVVVGALMLLVRGLR